jgi:hypothetical protein
VATWTLRAARSGACDPGHHGSDRPIAARAGELERLARRDTDACGDVVPEQPPRTMARAAAAVSIDAKEDRARHGRLA